MEPFMSLSSPPASSRPVTVVHRPGPAMLAGIAQVAAQMARADGSADRTEQRALLRFLRQHDLLRHFGRRACLDAYRKALALDEAPTDPQATPPRAAGTMAAPLIASAAASIALADGAVHPAELALLGHLTERLSLLGQSDAVVSLLFRPQ